MTPDVTRIPKPVKRARLRTVLPARAKPLLRSALSRRPSRKKRREQRDLDKAIAVVRARSKGRCEIQWSTNVCTVWGSEPHHRVLRSQGGTHDPDFVWWACHACHATAHANPAQARARRIILSKYEGDA